MTQLKIAIGVLIAAFSFSHATQAMTGPAVSLASTQAALELPLNDRLAALESQGEPGYKNLVRLMFDRSKTMETRWRAVTAAGRVGSRASIPHMNKALKSEEWFMRNAALVALQNLDREEALTAARRLLSDKALVVRAAAVETISKLHDTSSTQRLWDKLYAKENYKGRQSLFIRRRIVETLATMESKGREGQFVKLLSDNDETLHQPAMKALERITQRALGAPGETPSAKRAQWQKWWKTQTASGSGPSDANAQL